MPTVPFSEARTHLTDVVNEVAYGGKRVVLTRKGRELVAIVSLEDLLALEAMEDKLDLAAAKKAKRDVKKRGTISWREAKSKLKK